MIQPLCCCGHIYQPNLPARMTLHACDSSPTIDSSSLFLQAFFFRQRPSSAISLPSFSSGYLRSNATESIFPITRWLSLAHRHFLVQGADQVACTSHVVSATLCQGYCPHCDEIVNIVEHLSGPLLLHNPHCCISYGSEDYRG